MNRYRLIEAECDFDALVLADGVFPTAEIPLSLLRRAPLVVCCDGAASHFPQADVIIGDGDSLPPELKDRLIRIDEQEDNDLTKATRYLVGRGCRRIVYLGATGKREDHTLGNISLMARYALEMDTKPLMATDFGWFVAARGEAMFESVAGQQVSIFNVNCRRLCSDGLRWDAYPYDRLWQGTLNEATGSAFRIMGDGAYLVYRTYLPKP